MSWMTWMWTIAAFLIAGGALMALARVIIGPTMLNRMLALDVIVTIMVSALAISAAVSGNTTLLVVMASLTLLGFVGAVTVSRFSARDEQ
ncbi:MAG: monovalent cation/H+ antiporter complex subunit F [Candidatus Nanopelagicales bacterium]